MVIMVTRKADNVTNVTDNEQIDDKNEKYELL